MWSAGQLFISHVTESSSRRFGRQWSVLAKRSQRGHFNFTMDRTDIEHFVSDSVRSAVTERQNELLVSFNSLLNNRFDTFEKNFSEKQSAISEIQISRLRSSALGQYQL